MRFNHIKYTLERISSKEGTFVFLTFYDFITLIIFTLILIRFICCFYLPILLTEALIYFSVDGTIVLYFIYLFFNINYKLNRPKLIIINNINERIESFVEKEVLKYSEIKSACRHELIHRKIFSLFKIKSHCFLDFYFDSIFLKPENKLLFFPPIKFLNFNAYCVDIEKESSYSKTILGITAFFQIMYDIILGGGIISYVLEMLRNLFGINGSQKENIAYRFQF